MARVLREVVFVDGVRTAFGKAGPGRCFWRTRADDMAVKVVRELLRRNPGVPPERIGDVVLAATAQVGDQGLTLGRDVALLAGLPQSVPGLALDRMCAGALTAITTGAGEIAMGAAEIVIAGGVEHMGHHPMGAEVDFNPRFVAERLVDTSAVTMGATAENLHDRFPGLTKAAADRYAVESQQRAARRGRTGSCARPSSRWPSSPTTAGASQITTSSSGRRRRSTRSPACEPVPNGRARDRGQLGRPHRRCRRRAARVRGGGGRNSACPPGCGWSSTPSSASSPS